ncbi:MAG: GxxExxY protein [Candidatus Marinimicrobia bacterium]|nr:GxxExxY protein [Candidatus Neomarinimicrobiota bacterium]
MDKRKIESDKIVYRDLSYKIVGLAMTVHNELGYGFLEKVYENAMMVLFRLDGITVQQQFPIKVQFQGEIIGDYYADILVANKIILELKSIDQIVDIHRAQTLNYLKATGIKLALILNFGKEKLEYERLVL